MKKPYLYNQGLKDLSKEVTGKETIHMGIRPFGFHAGNLVSLYVYPYLFCEEVNKLGKPVNFTFIVSINDYEQDELDGPDYKRYPYNIYPKKTTLGHLVDQAGCHNLTIEHWLPIIQDSILNLKNRFPSIKIHFIKNSELKNNLEFKKILLETIKNPSKQLEIYKKHTNKETLDQPICYAGAVCPTCHSTKGTTVVHETSDVYIEWQCKECHAFSTDQYSAFNYWFYHKPLFAARMAALGKINITFSGDDHFSENDFILREELMKMFTPNTLMPKMFFAPLVLTKEGKRMSKTQKNTQWGDPIKLIDFCRNSTGNQINLTEELVIDGLNIKNKYNRFF